jgi:hypothetical protein
MRIGAGLALAALAIAAPAAADPPRFTISLADQIELDEGEVGTASLTITAEPGYSISQSGPIRIALSAEPAEGLELPRRRYQRGQAADRMAASPRFDLAVRGARAGRYRLAVVVRFWLCRGRSCRPIETGREVAVIVRAPAAQR